MAFTLNPNQAEFFARSSGFDFNNGDFSKFGEHWNTVDPNKKTQLTNYLVGQGASAGDIPDIISGISNRTPWGSNSLIGNPDAVKAQDKAVVGLAGSPNNLNAGNTTLYNSMVNNGEIKPFVTPASNSNPSAITTTPQGMEGVAGQDGGGVYPIGVREPLNDWQKTNLTKLNEGPSDPGYVSSAGNALSAANLGLTNPTANIDKYMNPYQDYITGNINSQYDALNNQVRSRAARMGNTGSSSEALQQSLNDKNRTDVIGQALAGNWNNAMAQASGNVSQNLGLGSAYTALDQYNTNKFYDAAKTGLGAGGVIQDNNQALLDAYNAEQDKQNAYPYQQLQLLMQILGAYPTGSTSSTTTPGNTVGGVIGGGLLGNYLGSTSGLLSNSSSPTQSVLNGLNAVRY